MTIVAETPGHLDILEVTLGVDTHAESHVAAVIDPLGRHLAQAGFETTVAGFKALLAWASGFGTITVAGVEGTGAYGAGLGRFLTAEAITVVEVDRPSVAAALGILAGVVAIGAAVLALLPGPRPAVTLNPAATLSSDTMTPGDPL